MPRKWEGSAHTTKQKGKSRKGSRRSNYSIMNKGTKSDRYDRPYLDGTYKKWDLTEEKVA